MTFPKFSSGSIGRLGFETMNDVFARIERLEQRTQMFDPSVTTRVIFMAQITGVDASGSGSFTEVNFGDFPSQVPELMTNGKTSSDGTDEFAYPALGANLTAGEIVMLVPVYSKDGKLVHKVVRDSVNSSFPAVVQGASVLNVNRQWKYTVKKVTISELPAQAYVGTYGNSFSAYNGPEWNTDGAGIYGVGMETSSTTATFIRKPIKTGTVVVCTVDLNGVAVFSIPNGYRVNC
jgi:hypothetical protein